jgi:hypothetical protein
MRVSWRGGIGRNPNASYSTGDRRGGAARGGKPPASKLFEFWPFAAADENGVHKTSSALNAYHLLDAKMHFLFIV